MDIFNRCHRFNNDNKGNRYCCMKCIVLYVMSPKLVKIKFNTKFNDTNYNNLNKRMETCITCVETQYLLSNYVFFLNI